MLIVSLILIIISIPVWLGLKDLFKWRKVDKQIRYDLHVSLSAWNSFSSSIHATMFGLSRMHGFTLSSETFKEITSTFTWVYEKYWLENSVSIFSVFIFRYVYNHWEFIWNNIDWIETNCSAITDEKILYALRNMEFEYKWGYLFLKDNHSSYHR